MRSNGFALLSADFRWQIVNGPPASSLGGAFGDVDVAIDHLKVRQTPISEQLRPRRIPALVPHPKQRDAVVDLGVLPEASAGFTAAPSLQAAQQSDLTTRCIPELPCDNAGAVPHRILVGPCIP
jgi:hypothetical protein